MMQSESLKQSGNIESATDSTAQIQIFKLVPKSNLRASLKALNYKSLKLQSRNYSSNVCQIITPLICLLFTVFCRIIVEGITTGAVNTYSYPQPFNIPYVDMAIRSQLNLSCVQNFYYQTDKASQEVAESIIGMQLKDYCPNENIFNPFVQKKEEMYSAVMQKIKEADITAFQRGDDLKTAIPDGLFSFTNSNSSNLKVRLSINDYRIPQYHKNNGVTKILIKTSNTSVIGTYLRVTEGLMSLIDRVTRPFLQKLSSSDEKQEILVGSYMYMPFDGEDTALLDKVVNVIGSGLYPLGLSLLIPIFLYMIVSEKEERQIQIMKMNGLDPKHYWVNFFIVSFILSMITSSIMYLVGAFIVDITFFKDTSFSVLWLTFVGWAIAQIALTSLVQIFINNSRTATIVGYLLSIFSTIIGEVLSTLIFPIPMTLPLPMLLYPPFALCRIVYYMGWNCSDTRGCYQTLSGIDGEMAQGILILYAWFLVYLLSIWLDGMVQQQYGVARTPYLIEKCLKYCRRKKDSEMLVEETEMSSGPKTANNTHEIELGPMQKTCLIRKEEELIDGSVFQHREIVNKGPIDEALVIREISKKYAVDNGEKDKIALKPLTMKLIKGQIFGFLGPNGAGKTTLISVLTGMYPQTSGKAWIEGQEIGYPSTNQLIGVCPQFDILWSQMTVEEHLRFYCKLKQIREDEIDNRVKDLLQEVDLTTEKDFKIRQLSGGMQRRVSIACAFSGRPSVVILDQPTSGLDPYHRREIWKILQRCKRNTSIFMTSHLMDEVEFLCDRIGIINQGQMRCIGDLQTLKDKFGKGYRLTISYPTILKSEESTCPPIVKKLIEDLNLEIINQLETRVVLKIEKKEMRECIERLKSQATLDWCINQPSLYDVFMHFVK